MSKKVKLQAYIDEEVMRAFWAHLKAKYERPFGALSAEVQNAIAHWLNEAGTSAHTQAHMNPGLPIAQAKIDQIIQWLKSKGFTNQFTIRDWQKACINTVGSDTRTIKKYLKLAGEMGRIKPITPLIWEII
jgi:hypothetical protein